MTPSEIKRAIESRRRANERAARERAASHYILADLIGISVSRVYSGKQSMPSIEKVYPSLFKSEEIQEQKKQLEDEISVIRFKQFAQSFNKRFKDREASENESGIKSNDISRDKQAQTGDATGE